MDLGKRDIQRLRSAMASAGTPNFFAHYRNLMRAKMPLSTFLMMRFDPGKAPALLDAWYRTDKITAASLTEYTETTYPFDPFFQFAEVSKGGGLYRISDIAPDRFFSSEYYLEYYRKTGLCDEIGLLVPLPSGGRAHLSISRFEEIGPFKRREIQCLRHHAPVLLELLVQHVSAISPGLSAQVQAHSPPLADHIRAHAHDVLHVHVTRREAQIAALVLQGHSNGSAALALKISRGTCKVHRRNLYRKFAISSQRDLFGLLKHLL